VGGRISNPYIAVWWQFWCQLGIKVMYMCCVCADLLFFVWLFSVLGGLL
jgi:hypothetical protein